MAMVSAEKKGSLEIGIKQSNPGLLTVAIVSAEKKESLEIGIKQSNPGLLTARVTQTIVVSFFLQLHSV